MSALNQPADTDYLFVCKSFMVGNPTELWAYTRHANTYSRIEDDLGCPVVAHELGRYSSFSGFDWDRIIRQIEQLRTDYDMPVRFSDSVIAYPEIKAHFGG